MNEALSMKQWSDAPESIKVSAVDSFLWATFNTA